jgi:DNA-binding transcriptional MerR regulator
VPRMEVVTGQLVPIGRFARITGLTVKALRHYDEIGLLRPAQVDPSSGYRYYALDQAREAEAVLRLRGFEIPLDDIRPLLDADETTRRERLSAHRARLGSRLERARQTLAELDALIDGKEPLVPDREKDVTRYEIDIRELPEQAVVGTRERVHMNDLTSAIPRGIAEVHGYLEELGVPATGPPITICAFPDADDMVDLANTWPVAEEVHGRGPIDSWTLPAVRALWMRHQGPYERLPQSYRLLEEVMAKSGLEPADAPREIYVTDPQEVSDPAEYVTEIAWPIGPEGELAASEDVFTRRVDPT